MGKGEDGEDIEWNIDPEEERMESVHALQDSIGRMNDLLELHLHDAPKPNRLKKVVSSPPEISDTKGNLFYKEEPMIPASKIGDRYEGDEFSDTRNRFETNAQVKNEVEDLANDFSTLFNQTKDGL